MRTTTLFLIRHGQKSGDANTTFGLEQLAASANAHLSGITLNAVFCSDMKRTMEAAEHILAGRANPDDATEVVKHPAFFVAHLSSPENMQESVRIDKLLGEHGTIREWHENWSQAASLTRGIVAAMEEMAEANVGGNVLVCNHAPLCGLAADLDTPAIGLADVVKYVMVDDGSGWKVTSSTHLPCPLKVPAAA